MSSKSNRRDKNRRDKESLSESATEGSLQLSVSLAGDPHTILRRACVDLLARREHACQELRRKLGTRFNGKKPTYSGDQIDKAIESLSKEGLQSELRFAETYTRVRYDRGDGPLKIKAALQQRGIHGDLISSILEGGPFDWVAKARTVYERKYARFNESMDSSSADRTFDTKQRAKEMRFLQSRGFPADIVYAVIEGRS